MHYMPRSSHSSRVYHPNSIVWGTLVGMKIVLRCVTPCTLNVNAKCIKLVTCYSIIPSAVSVVPPEDEQGMLETCRGS
jgi:hypothetical protein